MTAGHSKIVSVLACIHSRGVLHRDFAAQSPGALCLGLDVHRKRPLSTKRWPTAAQLKARGITNVPVLLEKSPREEWGLKDVKPDVRAYVESLLRAGLQVTFHGMDSRLQGPGLAAR